MNPIKEVALSCSDDNRRQMHVEFVEFEKSGILADDAILRKKVEEAMMKAKLYDSMFSFVADRIMVHIWRDIAEETLT